MSVDHTGRSPWRCFVTLARGWIDAVVRRLSKPHPTAAPPNAEISQEQIDEIRRRLKSDGRRYTTDEVLEHLRSLDSK